MKILLKRSQQVFPFILYQLLLNLKFTYLKRKSHKRDEKGVRKINRKKYSREVFIEKEPKVKVIFIVNRRNVLQKMKVYQSNIYGDFQEIDRKQEVEILKKGIKKQLTQIDDQILEKEQQLQKLQEIINRLSPLATQEEIDLAKKEKNKIKRELRKLKRQKRFFEGKLANEDKLGKTVLEEDEDYTKEELEKKEAEEEKEEEEEILLEEGEHNIEIELSDESGNPQAYESYEIFLPKGNQVQKVYSGILDAEGYDLIEDVEEEDYQVAFPRFEQQRQVEASGFDFLASTSTPVASAETNFPVNKEEPLNFDPLSSSALITSADPNFLIDTKLSSQLAVQKDSGEIDFSTKVQDEPLLFSGKWKDTNFQEINLLLLGKISKIHILTKNIKDGTSVQVKIFEYDPSYLDFDEEIASLSGMVQNNQILVDFTFPQNKYEEEWDGIQEIYFTVSISIGGKKTEYIFPEDTESYLKVVQPGVLITVIIELPRSNATDWIGRIGLDGHTGIAIGEEFYDYGPDYFDENQQVVDGRSYYNSPGKPWWDDEIAQSNEKKIKRVEDVDLTEVLAYIKEKKKQDIYTIEFLVTHNQASEIEKWWIDRYEKLGTYSVNPYTGEQCTTTVRISLQKAGVISAWGASASFLEISQTPKGFYNYLKLFSKNLAGVIDGKPAKGTSAKITKIVNEKTE